jgi:hypothetical protein
MSICTAIAQKRLLRLTYDWGTRTVEPHAYGRNSKGHELLRSYQVGGDSRSGESEGWKLFRVDEIRSLAMSEDTFAGPRPGYRRGDRAMDAEIYCEL